MFGNIVSIKAEPDSLAMFDIDHILPVEEEEQEQII
jgi:hypothetical protein